MTDGTERDWGDIENLETSRSKTPRFLFCCLGCLIPIVLLGLLVGWGVRTAGETVDEELQWQELAQLLPFDEQPESLDLVFGLQLDWFDFEFYMFLPVEHGMPDQEPAKWVWILLRHDESEAAALMEHALSTGPPWTPPGEDEPRSTITVQGQELQVVWLDKNDHPAIRMGEGRNRGADIDDGPAVVVLLPGPGGKLNLNLFVVGSSVNELTVTDLQEFLDHFQLAEQE